MGRLNDLKKPRRWFVWAIFRGPRGSASKKNGGRALGGPEAAKTRCAKLPRGAVETVGQGDSPPIPNRGRSSFSSFSASVPRSLGKATGGPTEAGWSALRGRPMEPQLAGTFQNTVRGFASRST